MSFNLKQPMENEVLGHFRGGGGGRDLTLTLTLLSTTTSQASQNHWKRLTSAKVASTSSLCLQQDLSLSLLFFINIKNMFL